jgi:hypothetical protein
MKRTIKLAGPPRDSTPPDLSPDEYDSVRKLIEELKRLYGRVSECLNDVERRDGLLDEIAEKQDAIAAIIPHVRT